MEIKKPSQEIKPIRNDQDAIADDMEDMIKNKYEAYSAIATAFDELKTAKDKRNKQELLNEIEKSRILLAVLDKAVKAGEKLTVAIQEAKVLTDPAWIVAIDKLDPLEADITTKEVALKLADNEWENYKDRFERLKSQSFMVGKVS